MRRRNVDERLRAIDATVARTAVKVALYFKLFKDLRIILDGVKTIVVAEAKIILLCRVRAVINLILSNDGSWVLVVIDAASLQLYKDGVALVCVIKNRIHLRAVQLTPHEGR